MSYRAFFAISGQAKWLCREPSGQWICLRKVGSKFLSKYSATTLVGGNSCRLAGLPLAPPSPAA